MNCRFSVALFCLTLTASGEQRVEQGGIAVDFSLNPAASANGGKLTAGSTAIATFRVTDVRTGQPLAGIRPKAWLSARRSEAVATETSCSDKVRTFMSGQISARADADLNSYTIATLNHDKTITFINPQIASNVSKLESVVVLPSNGSDWVLTPERNRILVTLPNASGVAVIDAISARLLSVVPTGESSKPVRIAMHPGGRFAWAGLDAANEIAVIDIPERKITSKLAVGLGPHSISISDDGKWASVTNAGADSVTLFDAQSLTRISEVKVAKTPVAQAWSSAAGLFYTVSLNGNAITAIDPRRGVSAASIPTSRGTVAIAFDPEGRLGFAVNQLDSRLTVFDPATNKIVGEGSTVSEPDQIAFTHLYAYIRGVGSEKFSLYDLSPLRRKSSGEVSKLEPLNIQAGRLLPSSEPNEIGPASMIVPTPEGNSVMIANAPDRMIYFYTEGMMAPMGTLQNYRRMPRGLMVLDRSLTETSAGIFTAPVNLSSGGRFDVPMLLDQPRLVHCFTATVEADSRKIEGSHSHVIAEILSTELFSRDTRLNPGDSSTIRIRLTDSTTHQPLSGVQDAQLLLFRASGLRQQREWLSEKQPGIYEAKGHFPEPGLYHVMVSVQSLGAKFSDLPFATVEVPTQTARTEGAK